MKKWTKGGAGKPEETFYNEVINRCDNILRRLKRLEEAPDAEARKALEEQPKLLNKISALELRVRELEEARDAHDVEANRMVGHITALREARNKAEKEASELKMQLRKLKESINV